MFEGILGYIVGGAVIGILARLFKPGADPLGWIMTIVLGIAGALAGNYLAGMFGVGATWQVWALAVGCAIVLLFLYELLRRKKPVATT
ncbi:GlsB/YeaQ/YmgE family stress response membrane protein [Cognatiluteimonas weifangensis]|uniref:GlsB/YeaQ/YmgE family stress response membrane protein n=1 Tax=Cognatiluteimonas weifangensis TaxID=2303539 RepID=A0A372DS62_9GAMM|nr:GlsB/YeaQ/YmgE family stress response membrane protein [Luteimonas weifangensis]RFP62418.1 GlsB/YeaQ/YmgE family stress response membrane protein [Luteimonas weifangensis]